MKQTGHFIWRQTALPLRLWKTSRKDFNNNMEVRPINISVEIPSIKKRYSGTGSMVSLTGGASGQKLLAGSQYQFKLVINGSEDIN